MVLETAAPPGRVESLERQCGGRRMVILPTMLLHGTHSTQFQFTGSYHPSQPPVANPHQLVHGMPGNIGVGVASACPGGWGLSRSMPTFSNDPQTTEN
ncbi:hypothetical protein Sjap_019731 [Stephania japonica]|uniref:Uncharacterized protein n=1 Tax=Stephania japonica TaxID=461633 RepID=A0AAP0HYE3_9MAGN